MPPSVHKPPALPFIQLNRLPSSTVISVSHWGLQKATSHSYLGIPILLQRSNYQNSREPFARPVKLKLFDDSSPRYLPLCSYPLPCLVAPPPPLFLLKPQLFFKAQLKFLPAWQWPFSHLWILIGPSPHDMTLSCTMYCVMLLVFLWSQLSLFNLLGTSPSPYPLNSSAIVINKFITIGCIRIWAFK